VLLDVEGATTCSCSVSPPSCNRSSHDDCPQLQCLVLGEVTYRNACRACASCCGAFRSWKFPSLCRSQSRSSVFGCGWVCGVLIVARN
jgi:hypothetical protein